MVHYLFHFRVTPSPGGVVAENAVKWEKKIVKYINESHPEVHAELVGKAGGPMIHAILSTHESQEESIVFWRNAFNEDELKQIMESANAEQKQVGSHYWEIEAQTYYHVISVDDA